MEEEGSYGIISYRELAGLKKDIEELKSKTAQDSAKPSLDTMAKLSQNMDSMLQLFKTTADEIKLEDAHGQSGKESELAEKVDTLLEQTKTIAEGMVAIADMVNELKESKAQPQMPKPQPIMQQPPTGISQPQQQKQVFPQQPPIFRQAPLPQQPPPPIQSPFERPESQYPPPFTMPSVDIGAELPLEPFPPLPEQRKRGLLGRFKK